ncbi:MAG: hypothetical protein HYT21_03170 [Candidatus Nealsonbacteria bacterium]|nr:hypothetical protein [Candidatus Nealsonbacteria bacterium]
MSLIFGVNLCDRIYLSADTRLTTQTEGGDYQYKDKLLKIQALSRNIIVAAAGHASMAAYIIRELLKLELVKLDIRTVRKEMSDVIKPIVDQYWQKYDGNHKVCFIFGGLNHSDKKDLNFKNVYQKVKFFNKVDMDSSSMNLKPALFNAMLKTEGIPPRYPEPSDSHIFSILITPPNGFNVEDAGWGEYLAYGPKGINKDALPEITFGKLEFETRALDFDRGHDHTVIAGFMRMVVEKYQENTIGGSVLTVVMSDRVSGVITGRVGMIDPITGRDILVSEVYQDKNGRLYRKDETGTIYKMVHLANYKDFGSLEL